MLNQPVHQCQGCYPIKPASEQGYSSGQGSLLKLQNTRGQILLVNMVMILVMMKLSGPQDMLTVALFST